LEVRCNLARYMQRKSWVAAKAWYVRGRVILMIIDCAFYALFGNNLGVFFYGQQEVTRI